jgi:hypothetical protein
MNFGNCGAPSFGARTVATPKLHLQSILKTLFWKFPSEDGVDGIQYDVLAIHDLTPLIEVIKKEAGQTGEQQQEGHNREGSDQQRNAHDANPSGRGERETKQCRRRKGKSNVEHLELREEDGGDLMPN